MEDSISADHKPIRWRSARFAALSVVAGAALFMFLDYLPILTGELSVMSITAIIVLAVLAILFSLPFAIIGGYIFGSLLQKTQWHIYNKTKAVISGTIVASVTLIIIFIVGGFLQSCMMSHGYCQDDVVAFMTRLIANELSSGGFTEMGYLFLKRFLLALSIAMVSGCIIGWRLSHLTEES